MDEEGRASFRRPIAFALLNEVGEERLFAKLDLPTVGRFVSLAQERVE